jgi:hypothetical protein
MNKPTAMYSPCCKFIRIGECDPGVLHDGNCRIKHGGVLGPTLKLYDQAALDHAVAAERERCAALCEGVREAADHAARDGHRKAGAMAAAASCAKLIRS